MHWPTPHQKALVLLYHRVGSIAPDPWSLCVTPEHFEEHLQVLQRYRRVRLDQIVPGERSWSGPRVAVTFDDGYADNFEIARPLLERFETPATFFITTGGIDSHLEFWWDELERIVFRSENAMNKYLELYERFQPLPHQIRSRTLETMCGDHGREPRATHRTLTSTELETLGSIGLFEIGAHTVTHPLLAAQPAEVQHWELATSKKWLEERLARPVTSISYPYGGTHHYNQETLDAVEQAGYRRACTTVPQAVSKRSQPWEWGRFVVTDMDGDQFQKFLFSC